MVLSNTSLQNVQEKDSYDAAAQVNKENIFDLTELMVQGKLVSSNYFRREYRRGE
jgi:hypothetical protein